MLNPKSMINVKRENGDAYVDIDGSGEYKKLTNNLLLTFFVEGGKYTMDDMFNSGLDTTDLPSKVKSRGKTYYFSRNGYTQDEKKQVLVFESFGLIEVPPLDDSWMDKWKNIKIREENKIPE